MLSRNNFERCFGFGSTAGFGLLVLLAAVVCSAVLAPPPLV